MLCGGDVAGVGHHFFLSSEGAPWSDSGLTQRLPRLVEREMAHMGKDTRHISVTMLRRIFVDGMRESGTRGSAFERGAAMVMGNTTREWDRTYDLNFKLRDGQNALGQLKQRRGAMQSRVRRARKLSWRFAAHCTLPYTYRVS